MEDTVDELLIRPKCDLLELPQNGNIARELLDAFKRHSEHTLVIDAKSRREWTGRQLLEHCGRVATCLINEAGVRPNDVAMTICDRDDSEVTVALGIVLSGAALYPTMSSDGYSEAHLLCELVQPDVLVINSQYLARAERLCANVSGMEHTRIVCIDDGALGGGGKALIDENNNNNNNNNVGPISMNLLDLMRPLDLELVESIASDRIDGCKHFNTYMLTSGSTGRPKVVPTSHEKAVFGLYSMLSAARNPIQELDSPAAPAPAPAAATGANNSNEKTEQEPKQQPKYIFEVSGSDVIAGDLPLDHGAGLNMMYVSLMLGAKYIVMPSFEVEPFWQAVSDFRITYSLASTSFAFKLFKSLKEWIQDGTAQRFNLESVRTISCCGAKLNFVDLTREITSHYPRMLINQCFGCTEVGYISALPTSEAPDHIDSVGYLFPGLFGKIVDPDNLERQMGVNEPGELLLGSPLPFEGYRCHPEVDAAEVLRNCTTPDGRFYRTGDKVHVDSEGRLHIHGRFKDTLVLMGDWKIMPAELEEVINRHPLVHSSVVVGAPDPDLPSCHKPRAFVLLTTNKAEAKGRLGLYSTNGHDDGELLLSRYESDDFDSISEHIREFVAARVAPAKQLTGGVRILEKFPTVGLLKKVDRKALKEMD